MEFTRLWESSRVDLSNSPEVPNDLDGEVFDRLTIQIIRETTRLDFEMEVWLAEICDHGPARSCGQRAKALAQATERLAATPNQKTFIENLRTKLEPALTIRNALVHGLDKPGSIDGERCIFMQTLEQRQSQSQARHCLTVAKIEDAITSIKQVTGQLSTFRSQRSPKEPSSPTGEVA